MKKVTQKQVAQYKRLQRVDWHDQAWHDAMAALPHAAISYAIDCDGWTDNKYIAEAATKYLNWEQ